ncbi:sigma-54-dependent transcriptional regulator [Desulfocurvus sp. DL9XJH121]
MKARILIIEDDAAFRAMLTEALGDRGYEIKAVGRAEDGLDMARSAPFDLVLTDVKLPGMSGVEAIPHLREASPSSDIIVMTAYSSKETAVEAVRRGAYDYFSKPFSLGELDVVVRRALDKRRLQNEVTALRETLRREGPAMRIIGGSPAMAEVRSMIERVAPLDSTVLITGESGTGKELAAETIRALSPRAGAPFIRVNCAAIPEHLVENELFGHEKGAFTGASGAQPGKFELAHTGTILLDEIGDMPLAVQPKLLRAVEQKQVERLGARRPLDVDVRIVAATNQPLAQLVREKTFREDLFYRLSVAVVELPPLRARREDIPQLARHFLSKVRASLGLDVRDISPQAMDALTAHHWPGNVRQLANVLERACITAASGLLEAADVARALDQGSKPLGAPAPPAPAGPGEPDPGQGPMDLRETLRRTERDLLVAALRRTGGKQTEAAALLGLSPKNLWAKLRKHDLDPKALS